MKRLVFIMAIFSLFSCEKFDMLEDISSLNEIRPNVYLSPVSPTANPGSELAVNVQYWSVDDQFNYLGLWHTIDTSTLVQIELFPSLFCITFEKNCPEENRRIQFKKYQFGYDDWSPDNNAYAGMLKYLVDLTYKKNHSQTSGQQTNPTLLLLFTSGFEYEFYTELVIKLPKQECKDLIVDSLPHIGMKNLNPNTMPEGNYLRRI